MADNTTLNAGTGGDVIATDDIGGVKHQLVKIEWGAADSATQTSTGTAALPVQGAAAAGASIAGNPVLVSGSNSGSVRAIRVDSSGRQDTVMHATYSGAATNVACDVNGQLITVGGNTEGASLGATASDITLIAGRTVGLSSKLASISGEGGLLISGYDGVYYKSLKVSAAGAAVVSGVTADGVAPSENPVLVGGSDGALTRTLFVDSGGKVGATVTGAGASGAAVSGNPVLVAGQDGTNARSMRTDTSGRPVVVGGAASGAAVSGNPVLVAGQDGTNARTIFTDSSGRVYVNAVCSGAAADGAAVSGNPVLMAGQDGTNVQSVATDSAGRLVQVGAAASGAAVAGNPVLIAGSDGTNVETFRTDSDGNSYTRPATLQTWIVSTGNTAHVAAARTTLLDLFNASGSGVILRVRAVYIIPALAAVTGVGQTYEIIRTSAVGTGGSTATPAAFDSDNTSLPAQVTARIKPTGGATTSATLIFVNGSSEETNAYASLSSRLNHVPQGPDVQPLVLREGKGLKIDQTTNSSVGNVNVVIVFTNTAT